MCWLFNNRYWKVDTSACGLFAKIFNLTPSSTRSGRIDQVECNEDSLSNFVAEISCSSCWMWDMKKIEDAEGRLIECGKISIYVRLLILFRRWNGFGRIASTSPLRLHSLSPSKSVRAKHAIVQCQSSIHRQLPWLPPPMQITLHCASASILKQPALRRATS